MTSVTAVGRIPVLCEARDLDATGPVVIVIHGMSTTPETLREGWPTADDGLSRIYWRLPVLREGPEACRLRREHDRFRDLFWPVVAEGRAELRELVALFAPRPVGLFGFSIGGLISLLGAADQRDVRAACAACAVPNLEYLLEFYPDYDWEAPDVRASRSEVNLARSPERLAQVPTLILHGMSDDVAAWRWMQPVAEGLSLTAPALHPYETFPEMQHRLVAQSEAEERDLARVRVVASDFFRRHLGGGSDRR